MKPTVVLGSITILSLVGCGGCSSSTQNHVVLVTIAPFSVNVDQGGTQNFIATVTGSSNTAVNWSVREGAAGGSITSAGVYTAPNSAGSFHVVATSQADATQSAAATVSVPVVGVSVQPNVVSMTAGESTTFSVLVSGTVNKIVAWSVQEPSGGQVSSVGKYTAPGSFGIFHVVATSQADPSKSAMATVTVAAVSVAVFPTSDLLGPQGVRQFSATVASAIQQAVTWSVQEGAAGGSIAGNGLYTAPNQLGDFHPVATSVVDPSKSATATVTAIATGFRPTGSMSTGRSAHSATGLQGGKVLVAGGNSCFFSAYYYYAVGSCPLDSAETYDPATGTFSNAGKLTTTRDLHTATLLPNGKVLLAGGPGATAELYDPTTATFTLTGNMSAPRAGHTATLLNTGKVLIVGGNNVRGALASAELYDPATGTFALTGSLTDARSFHTSTLLGNGTVLIVGGSQSANTSLQTAELYDPASGKFSATGSLVTARANHAATLLNNSKVLITGGSTNGNPLASAELYDIAGGSFTATGTMVMKRQSHVAVILSSGNVLLAGGSLGDFTAELYDPVAGTFTQTGSMATDRSLGAVAVLMDGRVLVAGGSDFASADIYQ
jgi:Galactose oxidase, central domain